MKTNKAVIFGAGNIGRGFLAELLKKDYHITFLDVDKKIITQLRKNKEYKIIYKESNDKYEELIIRDFNILDIKNDVDSVIEEIKNAELILSAIGVNNLKFTKEILETSLKNQNYVKKTFIACENAIRASSTWSSLLNESIRNRNQFLDCIVDRIVPGWDEKTSNVYAEKYKSIIIEKNQSTFDFSKPNDFKIVNNLDIYLQRKLFLLNGIHCFAAWLGLKYKHKYIHQAMLDQRVIKNLKGMINEIITILIKIHNCSKSDLTTYSNEVIRRFKNKELKDECSRVGRGVMRKLGYHDRLIAPYKLSQELSLPNSFLRKCIELGLEIKNDDPEVIERDKIKEKYPNNYINKITGINL